MQDEIYQYHRIVGRLRNCTPWKDIKSIIFIGYQLLQLVEIQDEKRYISLQANQMTQRYLKKYALLIDQPTKRARYKLVTVHRTAMCCRQREGERGLVYAGEVNHRPFKHKGPINHPVASYPYSNQFKQCRLGECVIIEFNGLW